MYRRKILAIAILSGLAIGFFMMERSQIFAEEAIQDELQTLCDQLNEFKRYEGKKIGYDETLSPSWELGREIVKYKKEAIPYLLDIFQNSDNQIAQVFAARLIAEIDYDRGIRLLETFAENECTVEAIFDNAPSAMTISDIAKKEIVILGEQKEKAESLIDPIQSKI